MITFIRKKQQGFWKITATPGMNTLKGKISEVKVHGALSQVVTALPDGTQIRSIVIETPDSAGYLQEGSAVQLIFKETEVILAKIINESISIQNQRPGTVEDLKKGTILCEAGITTATGSIAAVISREATDNMALKIGDAVVALVKQNEIMLAE